MFFHVWSLLSKKKKTVYFNLPALTFIRICNAKHDKSNVTYYSGQFYSAIILKTQTCRLLPFMCLFCVYVCALSTIYEMYRLPPLCADINVSSGRFRVRIYVWRSLRPTLDSVCACFSALSPDLLRRRNERDWNPICVWRQELLWPKTTKSRPCVASLSLSSSLSLPLSSFDSSRFHLKPSPSPFIAMCIEQKCVFLARCECNGWIDIVLEQAVGFSLMKY